MKFSWKCHSIIARQLSFSLNFLNFEYFSFVFETEISNLWKFINIQFMRHLASFINLNSTINPMYAKCRFQTFSYHFPFLIFVHRFTSCDWFLKDTINQSTIFLSLHNRKIHMLEQLQHLRPVQNNIFYFLSESENAGRNWKPRLRTR